MIGEIMKIMASENEIKAEKTTKVSLTRKKEFIFARIKAMKEI
jgi:hypothetical protein